MKIISCDFDNVLYNLEALNCSKVMDIYGLHMTPAEVLYWNFYTDKYPDIAKIWSDFSEYSKGQFFSGDQDFVSELQKNFIVQIVTASEAGIEKEKDIMIRERYGDIEIIHAYQKELHTENSILVDDKPDNIRKHIAAHSNPAIMVNRNYGWAEPVESYLVHTAHSFEDIIKHVEGYRFIK